MSPEIGQAATRIALFLVVAAGLVLLWVPRDSAEFVVLVLTMGVGLGMLALVALLARAGSPRWARRPRPDDNEGRGDDAPE